MSEFFDVVDEFKSLTEQYGFKLPKKLWYKNLVVLSKHIDDLFYCFVIARVWKEDGSLQTTLWVAPVQRPDDGLQNLSANSKVDIGYDETLDPEFFSNCEKKIVKLIDEGELVQLMERSKKELANPSDRNKRYEVYTQHFLPFFKKVVAAAGDDKKVLNNKKKCQPVIEQVFAGLEGEQKDYFNNLGLKVTIDMVWDMCYIYSL